jgi:hypothetical protein
MSLMDHDSEITRDYKPIWQPFIDRSLSMAANFDSKLGRVGPFAKWLVLGFAGASAGFLAGILWQAKVLNKTRQLHAILEIIKQFESVEARASRKYIHNDIPESLAGLSDTDIPGCGFQTMSISIPKRCRSGLRADADHDSDAMAITNCALIGTVIGTS